MKHAFLVATTVTALLALSGCGFEPVYGHKNVDDQTSEGKFSQLEHVKVNVPSTGRTGQILRIALEDALHPQNNFPTPLYTLTATIEEVRQPIIIERDASITRYNLILKSQVELLEIASGTPLMKKNIQRISSFNVSDSDFATYVAEGDARKRGTQSLAETIARNVAAAVIK